MEVSMRDMLAAGVHFGHQTRFWNPQMSDYIFGSRNKIHIINLEKTMPLFSDAMNYISSMVANGGTVLFGPDGMLYVQRQNREQTVLDMLKVKAALAGSDAKLIGPNCPGIITPGSCKIDIMQGAIARFKLAAYAPDKTIDIPRNACSFFEFHRAEEMADLGYERARKVLESLRGSAS